MRSRLVVELDQVLEDQPTPAVSARLHEHSAFRKPAKFDRRETEILRERPNLRFGRIIVARQEHDSPAAMYGWVLAEDGGGQMVEALDQSSAGEGLRAGLGGRLSSQFVGGHAVGIGHIDDGLPLPGGQRLRDVPVRLETDSQKDDVRLERFRQFLRDDLGSYRGRSGSEAFRIASGRNGHFYAAAGKRLRESLADVAEADNCVAHMFSFSFSSRSELVAATRLNRLARHPVAFIGSQERHNGRDFRRLTKASQRDFGLDRLYEFGILSEGSVRVRSREARRYGVRGNSARP